MPARSDPTHPCSPEWLPSLPFALQAAVVPKVIIPVAKAMLPIQLVQVGRGPTAALGERAGGAINAMCLLARSMKLAWAEGLMPQTTTI